MTLELHTYMHVLPYSAGLFILGNVEQCGISRWDWAALATNGEELNSIVALWTVPS